MATREGGRRWRDNFGQNVLGPDPEEASRAAERLVTALQRESDREDAIRAVIEAWTNTGINPSHHHEMQEMLRWKWPTLFYAMERLASYR